MTQEVDTLALGEESDDEFQYEEVEVLSDEEDDGASEDLDAALRSLQTLIAKDAGAASKPKSPDAPAPGSVTKRPEVMDDFLRNFFVKMGLSRTCEAFEAEWYELKATGRLEGDSAVPDVYIRNAELEEEVAGLKKELGDARAIAAKASATWDRFRKERDFHRMHHKRVAQEKNKLITDIKRLKEHYAKYEPTIIELKKKYETAMKEKMLVTLDRDKVQTRLENVEATLRATVSQGAGSGTLGAALPGSAGTGVSGGSPARALNNSMNSSGGAGGSLAGTGAAGGGGMVSPGGTRGPQGTKRSGWATITAPPGRHPFEDMEFPPANPKTMSLQKTFKGHLLSVAALALHPTKPILVTASDDKTWKMWHMPGGDLIMCGEGHKDWVAGVDFHPSGVALASGGGEGAVKIWDFAQQRCVLTLSDHKQAVWSVAYHHMGDVCASASLDHTVRLWDVPAGKCRMALRGHVDSVNQAVWQPWSHALATASSDKTVSIWDARSGLCSQTFYGHLNSCNGAAFSLMGSQLASCDADGMVKLWDVRMVAEVMTIATGKHPTNKAAFDRSGHVLAVASDDGRVKLYSTLDGELLTEFAGHEDAVQGVVWDHGGSYLVSCSSDHTFRLWS